LAAALARAHGAVHVAVPERRGLGAGPVDAIGGLADGAAVVEQDAGRGEADRAAARPDLLLPVGDVEGGRVGGLRAEVVAEVLQDVAAQVVARGAEALARGLGLDERHEDAGRARGRRVVEGRLRGRRVGHGLAREAGGAPERLGVDGVDLHHGAHRHALGELVAQRGQLRAVVDARRQRRRHGDDGALGGHAVAVGDRGHRAVLGDDPAHGPAQHDAVAEALGELDRHELRAADEAALLRATAGVDQPLDVPRVRLVARRRRGRRGRRAARRHAARTRRSRRWRRRAGNGPRASRRWRASMSRRSAHPTPWRAAPSMARRAGSSWPCRRAGGSPSRPRPRRWGQAAPGRAGPTSCSGWPSRCGSRRCRRCCRSGTFRRPRPWPARRYGPGWGR